MWSSHGDDSNTLYFVQADGTLNRVDEESVMELKEPARVLSSVTCAIPFSANPGYFVGTHLGKIIVEGENFDREFLELKTPPGRVEALASFWNEEEDSMRQNGLPLPMRMALWCCIYFPPAPK